MGCESPISITLLTIQNKNHLYPLEYCKSDLLSLDKETDQDEVCELKKNDLGSKESLSFTSYLPLSE